VEPLTGSGEKEPFTTRVHVERLSVENSIAKLPDALDSTTVPEAPDTVSL